MTMKIQKIVMMLVLTVVSVAPMVASAEITVDPRYGIGETNPGAGGDSAADVSSVIGVIITWLLGFVGALSVLVIIFGGIFYIISGGESGKTETAKGYILYAVVGLIVALLGWVIVNTVITKL